MPPGRGRRGAMRRAGQRAFTQCTPTASGGDSLNLPSPAAPNPPEEAHCQTPEDIPHALLADPCLPFLPVQEPRPGAAAGGCGSLRRRPGAAAAPGRTDRLRTPRPSRPSRRKHPRPCSSTSGRPGARHAGWRRPRFTLWRGNWRGARFVLKVDTEAHPDLAGRFGVLAIPNFVVLRNGSGVFQRAGLAPRAEMRRWLEQAP